MFRRFVQFSHLGVRSAAVARTRVASSSPLLRTNFVIRSVAIRPLSDAPASSSGAEEQLRLYSEDNTGSIVIPLTNGDKVRFAASLQSDVRTFIQQIKEEDPSVQDVVVKTPDGVRVASSTKLQNLMSNPFTLTVDGKTFTVNPQGSLSLSDGDVSLNSMLQQANVFKIRNILEHDPRQQMPFSEFVSICEAEGLSETEARQLAKYLHRTGQVFHFGNSQNVALRDTLFLKPGEVNNLLHDTLQVEALKSGSIDSLIERSRRIINNLHAQLQPMRAKKEVIDQVAKKSADRKIWVYGVGGLAIYIAAVGRLTFWELSWDVMEPLTYLITVTFNLGTLLYFIKTKREYTYEGVRERFSDVSANKQYLNQDLDIEKYNSLIRQIQQHEEALVRFEHAKSRMIPSEGETKSASSA